MADAFCPHIHHGLDVTPTGHLKPCCNFTGRSLRGDGVALNIAEHPLEAVAASYEVHELRRASLHNRPIEGCGKCYDMEASGGRSPRIDAVERLADLREARFKYARTVATGIPTRIMLQLGDLCNFRCRMCKPSLSSRIAADKVQRGLLDGFELFLQEMPRINTVARKARWYEERQVRDSKAYSYVKGAKTISLVGGEPTLIPIVRPLLRQLIEDGKAPEQTLVITTNGSAGDPEFIELLSGFKTTVLNVSVDGFDAVNDYIRFGSEWPQIDANIRKFVAAGFDVRLAVTVQIYNAFSLGELMRYARDVGVPVSPGWVSDPYFLDIQQFPEAVREAAAERILADLGEFDPSSSHARLLRYVAQRAKAPPRAPGHNVLGRFWHYTRTLDEDRGQGMESTLAALAAALADKFAAGVGPPRTSPERAVP